MEPKVGPYKNRVIFLDNTRSLMVLLVLIFHSAASYGSKVEFWPFHDANPSIFIDLFMFLCDVFMMAILFFIAGYFAFPSLKKSGSLGFMKGKLRRLGIPWLIVTILLLPLLDYLHYFVQSVGKGLPVWGYGTHWWLSMKRIAMCRFGWMEMSAYQNMTEHFYQRYMWFLSLLLLFFAVFVIVHAFYRRFKKEAAPGVNETGPSGRSPFFTITWGGIGMVVFFGLVRFYIYPGFTGMGWFSFGNLIQFQCGKLVIYTVFFILGCYAYHGRWFTGDAGIGRPWIWGLLCICLFPVNMILLKFLNATDTPALGLRLGFVVFYPAWALFFLGWFISFAKRHWNRPTRFNRTLASNSYRMYLVHYVFPMTLPLIISHWQVPTMLKFGTVAVATLLFSYGISRYLLKSFPRAVVAGLVSFSIFLALMT